MHDRGSSGFRAIYDKAGMPASAYPAFREAVVAVPRRRGRNRIRDLEPAAAAGDRACADGIAKRADVDDIESLLILLRRYAAEAAREDARLYCEELVADRRRDADRAAA